jgi:hypothetical protein
MICVRNYKRAYDYRRQSMLAETGQNVESFQTSANNVSRGADPTTSLQQSISLFHEVAIKPENSLRTAPYLHQTRTDNRDSQKETKPILSIHQPNQNQTNFFFTQIEL